MSGDREPTYRYSFIMWNTVFTRDTGFLFQNNMERFLSIELRRVKSCAQKKARIDINSASETGCQYQHNK